MNYQCSRGCIFSVRDVVIPAKFEADGVTVSQPERVEPGAPPELCPMCRRPYVEHPSRALARERAKCS